MNRMGVKKKFLTLTNNNLISYSIDELLDMIDNDIREASTFSLDYAYSISLSILKKLFLLKDKDFNKFYKIITSKEFRSNRYIYRCISKDNYYSLRDLFNIYKDEDLGSLLDYIFIDNKYLFNEMVLDGNYNFKDIFSYEMSNHFRNSSYRNLLGYLLKGRDKKRVIKALLRKKNNKYIYVISKMDDMVLSRVEDDSDYFDAVLWLLKYRDYRHLIWNYYDRYIKNSKNEFLLNCTKYDSETLELQELLHYSFALMNVIYSSDRVPDIVYDIDLLVKSCNDSKDMVHRAVFGVEGYKKVRNGTFDILLDFPSIDNENQLLNLKVAFFSTIYGLTYNQAEKLINSFDDFNKEYKVSEKDELIYDTLSAMKSLYNLTLSDKEEINLYREVYYKYVKKNGVHATIEIEAMMIMEALMRRMYNSAIELL